MMQTVLLSAEPRTEQAFRLGYKPFFDGLRGISILAVIIFHLDFFWFRGGFLGVDIFFVLSGFLITVLLYQEWQQNGTISLKNFYIRRGLRLFPALALVLIVVTIVTGEYKPSLYALSYCANWVQAFTGYKSLGVLTHTWSLAVEEQFYLLWPLLFVAIMKLGLKRRAIVILLLALIAAVAINRAAQEYAGQPIYRVYNGFDTRADALLLGCLTGLLVSWQVKLKSWLARAIIHYGAIGASLMIMMLSLRVTYLTRYMYYGLFTVVAAGVCVILYRLLDTPPKIILRLLENPVLVWIGRVSYGLYLWHLVIFMLIRPNWPWPALVALQLSVLLIVVTLSFYLVEQPCLKLKKRFSQT
jgi:peptidoglycan/LPS O-acetylase OafA/YrhL